MDYYCGKCQKVIEVKNAKANVNYQCSYCGVNIYPRFKDMPVLEESDAKAAIEEIERIFRKDVS